MSTKNIFLLILSIIIFTGSIIWYFNNLDTAGETVVVLDEYQINTAEQNVNNALIPITQKIQIGDESIAETEIPDANGLLPGLYDTFEISRIARANYGAVVLFFKSESCATCTILENDIRAKKSVIPNGVTILNINYNNALDLREKYEVTTPHTLVQVNQDGTLLKKWNSSITLEELTIEIE